MHVAIIGSGIAGLGCAWLLQKQGHRVTLFEANDYLGGHTHTVDVTLDGITAPVDTGFLVYNDRTYPRLIADASLPLVFRAGPQSDRVVITAAHEPLVSLTATDAITYNCRPFGELAQLVRAEES